MGNSESHVKIQGVATGAFYDHRKDTIVAVTKNTIQYYNSSRVLLRTVVAQRKHCVNTIAYIEDDDLFVTADDDCRLRVYQVESGEHKLVIPSGDSKTMHTDFIRCLLPLSYDRILSGGSDGTVRLWNYKSGERIAIFAPDGPLPAITSLAYPLNKWTDLSLSESRSNKTILGNSLGLLLHCYSTTKIATDPSTCLLNKVRHGNKCFSASPRHDPKRNIVFAGGNDGTIKGYDLDSGRLLIQYKATRACVLSMIVCTVADVLCASSLDGVVRLWDIDNGKETGGYKFNGNCLMYDKLRDITFCGSENGYFSMLQILNAGPGKAEIRKIKSLEFHRAPVSY